MCWIYLSRTKNNLFLFLSSCPPAPMVNQCLGHRRSAAVHAAATCGSGCPSTSRRRRTIRLPSSSPSPRLLRNVTVEGGGCPRMSLFPPSPPCPPCLVIPTLSQTRPCMIFLKRRSATLSPIGHRHLRQSARSARGWGQVMSRSLRWLPFQSTRAVSAVAAVAAVVLPPAAALLLLGVMAVWSLWTTIRDGPRARWWIRSAALWTASLPTSPSSTAWCWHPLQRTRTTRTNTHRLLLTRPTHTCCPAKSRCPRRSPLTLKSSPFHLSSLVWGAGVAVLFTPCLIHRTPCRLLTPTPPPPSPPCEEDWSPASPTPLWGGQSWKRSSLLWLHRRLSAIPWGLVAARLSQRQVFVSLQYPPILRPLPLRLGTADWHSETTARVHPHCEAE